MSNSSLHALGSADDSGYFTGRPRDNPPSSEPEEDPSECSESENEASSREVTRENTRISPTPVPSQPPQNGVRMRATARMSVAPPFRFAFRDFPPGTGPSGTIPSRTVAGIPISRDPDMTFRTARRVDVMTHDLQTQRAWIAHHGEMLGNVTDLTERLIYRANDAREAARAAVFWCKVLAGFTFLLAMMLIWIVWFRG